MVLSEKALRRLFPPGNAFKLPGGAGNTTGMLGQVVSALSLSFERLRTFFKQILTESIPFTSVMTLPAWYQAFGMLYDPTRALADLQAQADATWANTGGQYLNYLNAQIQKELPQIYIQEVLNATPPSTGIPARINVGRVGVMRVNAADPSMVYQVLGTVPDRGKYNRLLAILARIAPLHLSPYINVIITAELGLGRIGIAQVNNARVGKGS